ncbi:hypothetical protein [Acetobacter nitrogenifigens]|uniref:hypothetical protein n=1 Tax=Acetobacter nitrogenifigens TaxID=285268 RepID=UPI001FEDE066|nr:hypothetical protein [Acetobacter nitrogenifigens]
MEFLFYGVCHVIGGLAMCAWRSRLFAKGDAVELAFPYHANSVRVRRLHAPFVLAMPGVMLGGGKPARDYIRIGLPVGQIIFWSVENRFFDRGHFIIGTV